MQNILGGILGITGALILIFAGIYSQRKRGQDLAPGSMLLMILGLSLIIISFIIRIGP